MKVWLVVNPAKVDDAEALRAQVGRRCQALGWPDPEVAGTTEDDPGEGMARTAVRAGAELVLSAGGDGTVTSVARGLAGTGIPLGVLPLGTGNLLARNLDLPLDLAAALEVALCGRPRRIDLGTAAKDGEDARGFTVMAGIGFDAAMMTDTHGGLKRVLGWPAYVVSGGRHLLDAPMTVELRFDDGAPVSRRARCVVVGNVGTLQAGLRLLPDARPDDGLLDVVVLSPRGLHSWVRVVLHLLSRQRSDDHAVERFRAARVELAADAPQPAQLDGDPDGDVTRLVLGVEPGALVVQVP